MGKRIVVGVIAAAILIVLIILHGWYIRAAVIIVSLAVQYEMIKTVKAGGSKPVSPVLYAFTALLFPAYYFYGLDGVFILQMIAVALIFIAGVIFDVFDFDSIFTSIFTMYYPQLFFVFLYMIICMEDVGLSRVILVVSFVASVLTDTFAYFVGRACGKKKLCPRISPNKTVEGAIGGLVGGVVGVVAAVLVLGETRVPMIVYIFLAVLLSAMAQVGDLSASVVKRRYGIKDFGSILPGHGGLLDRLDSVLFILPISYLFYTLYLHI